MSRDPAEEFSAWLAQQQAFLQTLTSERDPARLRKALEQWWSEAGAKVGGVGQELAAKLLELGQTYLQGLQQFASAAAEGKTPEFSTASTQQPFAVGGDLLSAWRNARLATDYTSFGATGAAAAPWLEAVGKLPPIGPGREYITEARELAAAHAECQRLEEALAQVLKQVQMEALELLQQRVAERTQAGEPPQSFRQLYDVWIECGERVYSRTAHTDAFSQLQADFANALMRLRGLQRRVAERSMRKLDLPTRAELNTLHRQVRDLKRKLAQYESAASSSQAAAQGPTRAQTSAPPRRARAKTSRTRGS